MVIRYNNETKTAQVRRTLEMMQLDLELLSYAVRYMLEGKPESEWKSRFDEHFDKHDHSLTVFGLEVLVCESCGETIWSMDIDDELELCPSCRSEHYEGLREDEYSDQTLQADGSLRAL